jgi:hypothetical protein
MKTKQTKLSVRTHLQAGGNVGELCTRLNTNCEARDAKTGAIRRDIWECNTRSPFAGSSCAFAVKKAGYPDPEWNPNAPIQCYKC